MYKFRCIIQTTKWLGPFSSASRLLSVFLSDLAVFMFPTLLADYLTIIKSRHRVLIPWVQLHIDRVPLFLNLNVPYVSLCLSNLSISPRFHLHLLWVDILLMTQLLYEKKY